MKYFLFPLCISAIKCPGKDDLPPTTLNNGEFAKPRIIENPEGGEECFTNEYTSEYDIGMKNSFQQDSIFRKNCGAGQMSSGNYDGECIPTPPGFYRPASVSKTDVYVCNAGYICKAGSTSGSPADGRCPAGYACRAGTTNSTVGGYPELCKKGYFALAGSGECYECPEGSYTDVDGQGSCAQCPPGYYCPFPFSSPLQCLPGFYCPGNTKEQIACEENQIQPETAQISCIDCSVPLIGHNNQCVCPDGYYKAGVAALAQNDCVECPAGSKCQFNEQVLCDVGFYSSVGQAQCTMCTSTQYCNETGMSAPMECSDYPDLCAATGEIRSKLELDILYFIHFWCNFFPTIFSTSTTQSTDFNITETSSDSVTTTFISITERENTTSSGILTTVF